MAKWSEYLLETASKIFNESETLDEPVFVGVIHKWGPNDFDFWQPDVPQEVIDELEKIFMKYAYTGCSVRGTAQSIGEELKDI